MRSIVAAFKLVLFLAWTFIAVPFQCILLLFYKGPQAYIIPRVWHRGVCKILGLKVEVVNPPPENAHALFYVGNHVSSFDIPVLGSVLKASFVAKREIRSWPLFGFLATVQQTAFISRAPDQAEEVKLELSDMIKSGKNIIFFGEGSSSPGITVKPFKSSVFGLAQDLSDIGLKIQPFTLVLKDADGRSPDNPKVRDIYAWYDDMYFAPHFWNFARHRGATVQLVFHDPIEILPDDTRKTLAQRTRDAVLKPLEQTNATV